MKKNLTVILAGVLLIILSCSQAHNEQSIHGDNALLRIGTSLELEAQLNRTRATSTNIKDFVVIVVNDETGLEVVRELMPANGSNPEYILPAGSYTVTITSHPNGIPQPSFDVQVYSASQSVVLRKGVEESISLTCTQINAGVYFKYLEDAAQMDIIPTIVHADGSLVYPTGDNDATGYFAPGQAEVSFTKSSNVIKVNGQDVQTITLAPADLWEIGLKIKMSSNGDLIIEADVVTVTEPTETPEWELEEEEGADEYSVTASPGTLQVLIEAARKQNIITLKIEGSINSTDYDYMRSAAMPNLAMLDLSKLTDEVIPAGAMQGKNTLTTLLLPEGLKTIENNAFRNCRGLTGDLVLPSSIEVIGNSVFENCSGFNGILSLSPELSSIGTSAFTGCGFTGDLTIPENITVLATSVFSGCKFDGYLSLNDNLESIGNNAFKSCKFIGSLNIPDKVTLIGNYAFQDCTFTGSLTLGAKLEMVRSYAFNDAGFTGNLVIPSSVTTIDTYAFQGCTFDGTLSLSNQVTDIGNYTFDGCPFKGALDLTGITKIGTAAFRGCAFDGELTLDPALSSLGTNAFNGCSKLTGSLVIPETIRSINGGVFQDCSGFNGSLTLGSATTSISNDAFNGCSGFIGTLEIPQTVSTSGLGMRAFAGCTSFEDINVYWEELSKIPTYRANMFPINAKIIIPTGMLSDYDTKWASRSADESDSNWQINERE